MSSLTRSASTRSTRSTSNGSVPTKSDPTMSGQTLTPQSSLTRRASHKHNDYSCYIHVINKSDLSLELVNSKASSGRWASGSPPQEIEANSKTLIELTDPKGPTGSEGQCTYRLRHPQKSNAITFNLKFGDPYWPRDDNYLDASTQYPTFVGLNVLNYQNKGHPFIAHVEIDALQVPGLDRTKSQRSVQSSTSKNSASTGDGDEKATSETSSDGLPEYHSRSNSSIVSSKQRISTVQAVDIDSSLDYRSHVKKDSAIVMIDDISVDADNQRDDEGAPGDAVVEDSNSWPEQMAKESAETSPEIPVLNDSQDVADDPFDEQFKSKSQATLPLEDEDALPTNDAVADAANDDIDDITAADETIPSERREKSQSNTTLPTIEESDSAEPEIAEDRVNDDTQPDESPSKTAEVSSEKPSQEVLKVSDKELPQSVETPTIEVTPPIAENLRTSTVEVEPVSRDLTEEAVEVKQSDVRQEETHQPKSESEDTIAAKHIQPEEAEQPVEKDAKVEQPEVKQEEVSHANLNHEDIATSESVEPKEVVQPDEKAIQHQQPEIEQPEAKHEEIASDKTVSHEEFKPERPKQEQPAARKLVEIPEVPAPTEIKEPKLNSTPVKQSESKSIPTDSTIPTTSSSSSSHPTDIKDFSPDPEPIDATTDTEEEEYIRVNEPKFESSPPKTTATVTESRWASIFKSRQTHLGIVAIIFLSSWGYTATKVSGGLLLRFAMWRRRSGFGA